MPSANYSFSLTLKGMLSVLSILAITYSSWFLLKPLSLFLSLIISFPLYFILITSCALPKGKNIKLSAVDFHFLFL